MQKILKSILVKLFWGFLRHILSDEWYAKIRYRMELNEWPNIKNPEKFTEKIQYLKLYERTAFRKKIADRTAVRSYVAAKAGENYLIPLIGTFNTLTETIWEALPSQFVLKANHGCGMVQLVQNKKNEAYDDIYRHTEKWKQFDYARFGREWVYKGLARTIIAENLLLDKDNLIPNDYKFFCLDGSVELIQVDFDRFGKQQRNLYDRDFKELDATLLYPKYRAKVQKPDNLDEAIKLAETLAADLNFIRVDLYLLKNQIYFGELTNYPGNGFVPFSPESFEYQMGSLLKL